MESASITRQSHSGKSFKFNNAALIFKEIDAAF